MKWNLKGCMKCILALIMIVGMPMAASASEGNTGDAGRATEPDDSVGGGMGVVRMEGSVNTDVYQVVLPTNEKDTFDFILDPQGLINKTNAAAYGGKKFEADSTVFFKRKDGKVKEDYSSDSDFVTIINKSSVPVDVFLNVKVSKDFPDGIRLTEDRKFKSDTGASIYLALKDEKKEMPIGRDGLSLKVTVDAAPDGAYEYSYDKKSKKYDYKLKDDTSNIIFDKYSFQLTGASNGKGDWSNLTNDIPGVEVTWKVSPKKGKTLRKDAILNYSAAQAENEGTDKGMEAIKKTESQSEAEPESSALEQKQEEVSSKEKGENKAPSVVETSYTLDAGKPLAVKVDLGAGDMAANKVASVRWKGSEEELLDGSGAIVYKDSEVVFSTEWVDECIEDGMRLPAVMTVSFNDVNSTEAEIMLKK